MSEPSEREWLEGLVPERPVTLDDVRRAAADVFTPEGVEIWVDARNRLLEGLSPRQLVEQGQGDEVLRALEGLAEGVVF